MAVLSTPSFPCGLAGLAAALALFTPALAAPHNAASTGVSQQPATQGQSNALISTPLGAASVLNACPFTVHSNIVHSPRPDAEKGVPPEEIYSVMQPGEELEHPFVHDPGMGISWKLWIDDAEAAGGPVQFEWAWVPDARQVWWDLSMIDAGGVAAERMVKRQPGSEGAAEAAVTDGTAADAADGEGEEIALELEGVPHAFAPYGLTLQPHRGGSAVDPQGLCSRIDCPAGEGVCRQAYNAWNDWGQQHDCAEDVSLRVVLCG